MKTRHPHCKALFSGLAGGTKLDSPQYSLPYPLICATCKNISSETTEKKSLCLKTHVLNCRQARVSVKDGLKAAQSNSYSNCLISNSTPKIKHMPVQEPAFASSCLYLSPVEQQPFH